MSTQEQKQFAAAIHLWSGATSSFVACLALQPLDLIKTRLQQATKVEKPAQRMWGAPTVRIVKSIVTSNQGVRGLWSGTTATLLRTVPGVGLYFATLDWLQRRTIGPNKGMTSTQAFVLGTASRSVVAVMLLPFTVVKSRYESGLYKYKGVSHAMTDIVRAESIRGLFSGLWPTVLRDAPFSGIYYALYQRSKNVMKDNFGQAIQPVTVHLGAGVFSG
eukprot:Colp12_sorted_trinity150504_noHs@3727